MHGERLNILLDSNLFNQEFVPERHKFHDGRAKSDISLVSIKRKGAYEVPGHYGGSGGARVGEAGYDLL